MATYSEGVTVVSDADDSDVIDRESNFDHGFAANHHDDSDIHGNIHSVRSAAIPLRPALAFP